MPLLLIALLLLTGCDNPTQSQDIITPSGAKIHCDWYQETDTDIVCILDVGLIDHYTAYKGPKSKIVVVGAKK